MMRLTFLMLFGNAIFYLIQAVSCCRILTRRFSWPVMVLGFAVGYLLFVLPAIPFPETGMIRGMIALVSFPLVDMVLFRDKWYRCLFCGVAAVLIMSAADMISAAVLLTPEQLRQGLTFQPIPVQLTSYAIFLSASAFFLWMFTLLMNRYKYRLSGREWALYLLFPVSQCLLLYDAVPAGFQRQPHVDSAGGAGYPRGGGRRLVHGGSRHGSAGGAAGGK